METAEKRNWEGEVLTRWQMAKLYREAADKREEIRILHEITLLPCEEVKKILMEEGCALPQKRRSPGERDKKNRVKMEQALALWKQGLTLEEIAAALGLCRSTAFKYVRMGRGLWKGGRK